MVNLIKTAKKSNFSGGNNSKKNIGTIVGSVGRINVPENRVELTVISGRGLEAGSKILVEIQQITEEYKDGKKVPLKAETISKINTVKDLKNYVNGGIIRINRCSFANADGKPNADGVHVIANWGPNTIANTKELSSGVRELFEGIISFEPQYFNSTESKRLAAAEQAKAAGNKGLAYLGKKWYPDQINVIALNPEHAKPVSDKEELAEMISAWKENLEANHKNVPFHFVVRAFRKFDNVKASDEEKVQLVSQDPVFEKRDFEVYDIGSEKIVTKQLATLISGSRTSRSFSELTFKGDDGFGGEEYKSFPIEKQIEFITSRCQDLLALVAGQNADHKGEEWGLEVIPGRTCRLTQSYKNPKNAFGDIRSIACGVEAVEDTSNHIGFNRAVEAKGIYAGYGSVVDDEIALARKTPSPFSGGQQFVPVSAILQNETSSGNATSIALEIAKTSSPDFATLKEAMDKGEDISGTLNHPVKAADIYTANIGEDAVQKQYLEEIGLVAASMTEKYDETLKATLNKEAEERRNNKKEETPDASDTPDANQEDSSLDADGSDDEDNSMSNEIPF
jgi:hypothetical protein